jgi:HK97 family phage major capsid protein/HK97 family phage prohead protease
MATYKGVEIDLTPTDAMASEAERGLAWREEYGRGGTEVGVARARDIKNKAELSPETIRRMTSFFARHEVDKQADGFSPGEEGYPSAGRIAWALWGGDPGKSWANDKADRMDKIDEEERGLKAKAGDLKVGDFVSWNSSGGRARGKIDRIVADGQIDVPDSDFTINGTEDDPAALIQVYQRGEEGWEATETMVGHKFSTLTKIDELRAIEDGEPSERSLPVSTKQNRSFRAEDMTIEDEEVEFSFSSEAPVARYFGDEVLSHDDGAADFSRLNDGAPLLFNHNMDDYIGVVTKAYIKDKKGYARVRFANHERAKQIKADIDAGILRNVSFAYEVRKYEQDTRSNTYRGMDWMAYEVSVVTVPADQSIGFGRSHEPAESSAQPQRKEVEMSDVQTVRDDAVKAERERIATIQALGEKLQKSDLARQLVESGRSVEDARAAFLESVGVEMKPVSGRDSDVGLSDKEVKQFSFVRAINALANPSDRDAQEAAGFEREVSRAAAQKNGRNVRGIMVPTDVLRSKRDLTVGTASAGGNLVATDLLADSFIDLLRNRSVVQRLGAGTLNGLVGNIAVPKQSGGATAYWVAESGAPTESQQTIAQVTMTPKTLGAYTDFSRRLILQSSIDVETMVRNDLVNVIALEVDRAALYGSGSSNQPTGLKNITNVNTKDFAAAVPTFAELVGMETEVAADNADIGAMAYVVNAAMRGSLKTSVKFGSGTEMTIWEPGNTVNGYRTEVSNQIVTGDVFFGAWSNLILGFWSGIDLTVDPYAGATSGTVRVIALQDMDLMVRYPEAFCYGDADIA